MGGPRQKDFEDFGSHNLKEFCIIGSKGFLIGGRDRSKGEKGLCGL